MKLQICSIGLGCATVSIFDRFRTPAWRPYRAGMFVLMGLSAIFPIVHGLKLYGFEDMKVRMGLNWMILQGFLYILGAGLYAVSIFPPVHPLNHSLSSRHAGLSGHGQELSISGEVHTRSSMFSWSWQPPLICTDSRLHSTTAIPPPASSAEKDTQRSSTLSQDSKMLHQFMNYSFIEPNSIFKAG